MGDEEFQAIADELRELASQDHTFPIMSMILDLVEHAENLRDMVAELATGLDDYELLTMVDDLLG